MQDVAGQLANGGGFGLFIDYGHGKSGFGDTLQAIRKHAFTNPLAEPGEADLTTHVDFQVLAESARQKGCDVSPLLEQGTFLFRLGIDERKQRISGMQPHLRNALETACERLIGNEQMGRLFKVMGISSPSVELPALGSAR